VFHVVPNFSLKDILEQKTWNEGSQSLQESVGFPIHAGKNSNTARIEVGLRWNSTLRKSIYFLSFALGNDASIIKRRHLPETPKSHVSLPID
jgi:hypothetical protein